MHTPLMFQQFISLQMIPNMAFVNANHSYLFFLGNINDENVWKWVPKAVFKIQDYPTVNEFEIVVLLGQVWMYAKKDRILKEEERT